MRKSLAVGLVALIIAVLSFSLGRITTNYRPTSFAREASIYAHLVWFCYSQNTPDFYLKANKNYFNSVEVQDLLKDTNNPELLRVAKEARKIIEVVRD